MNGKFVPLIKSNSVSQYFWAKPNKMVQKLVIKDRQKDFSMEKSMRKKTALITGAGLRIGAGIATHLAKENYNLILHYNQSKEAITQLKKKS